MAARRLPEVTKKIEAEIAAGDDAQPRQNRQPRSPAQHGTLDPQAAYLKRLRRDR